MAKHFEGAVEEHLQRFREPDGGCLYCGHSVNRFFPVGPICVTVSSPDDGERMHEFCNWRCVGSWFAQQAGGDFVEVRQ